MENKKSIDSETTITELMIPSYANLEVKLMEISSCL